MGTVLGVLVGATLLKLLLEKLRFVSEYSADGLRPAFDPHDAVPARGPDPRASVRQLEFHEEDEELAERIEEEVEETGALKGASAVTTAVEASGVSARD